MRKQVTSVTLTPDVLSFLAKVAELNQISRSQAVELISSIVQDYFTDNQITAEHSVRGRADYRSQGGRSE